MVFEDLQWADAALLDFIEYLMDWARALPIFVVTQARPELAERRPNWGAGKRNFTSLYLEPLSDSAVDELLRGLVPGLPDDLRMRIRERSEGIPLYAVETVRMLLDRGLLELHGNTYRPTGTIPALEVPETLHALIAARLDGLTEQERRLLQDGSVLGKSFSKAGLAALPQPKEVREVWLDPQTFVGIGDMLGQRVPQVAHRRFRVVFFCDARAHTHHLSERPVRNAFAVGKTASAMPPQVVQQPVHVLLELPREARLADTGDAHDGEQMSFAFV